MATAPKRKPVDQAAPGREQIWSAVRAQGDQTFSVADIAQASGAQNKTVRDYCKALTIAGYLLQQPQMPGRPALWTLIRDTGHEAPRVRPDGSAVTQGATTEQLWRGMYMLKEFSFDDLIETASVRIPVKTAKAYCKLLLATRYLRVIRKAEPVSGRIARYRLIRNNGPRPPQIQRVKRVFDPNTGEVFFPETPE